MIDGEENRLSFEQLYLKYKTRVIQICEKYLKCSASVEDACSETFFNLAKAYNRIKDFEPHKLDKYIYITAKNSSLLLLNDEKASMNDLSFEEIGDTISTEDLEKTDYKILMEYIEMLPPAEKEILYLRITLNLDYKTIGTTLKIKPNNARQRFLRAKIHLTQLLKGEKLS
jgi:RNA polymerase sigma-70 factor (ECF subfamily)